MTDDELRQSLAAADPAADLPPLSAEELTTMIERATKAPQTPTGGWGRRLGIAAAVAAVAGAGTWLVWPHLVPAAPIVTTEPVVRLVLPESHDPMMSCPMLEPELFADAQLAFAATVTGLAEETASLKVSTDFHGVVPAGLEVERTTPEDADFSGFDLVIGESYLFTTLESSSQTIALCGMSGPDSPELRAIYEKAFG